MARAFLALGANLGDREQQLRDAIARLDERCGRVVSVSSLYASKAMVMPGDTPGPDYLNAVCDVETALAPDELLGCVKRIERAMGRRPAPRWSARPIDIDIVLYDGVIVETPALTIPHPGAPQRNFVMVPLAELAPDVQHPVLRRAAGDIAAEMDYGGLQHVAGPEWAGARFARAEERADV